MLKAILKWFACDRCKRYEKQIAELKKKPHCKISPQTHELFKALLWEEVAHGLKKEK